MVQAANLGFPRIGAKRELKKVLEGYWKGTVDRAELEAETSALRSRHWALQAEAGLGSVPSGDFTLYDHVLDTTAMLGAVPERFGAAGETVDLDTYFAMARGTPEAPAMEMTKWFDTNYHYIVPELWEGQSFGLASLKPVEEFIEARDAGIPARPMLLGPVTWLMLGKSKTKGLDPLALLPDIVPIYEAILARLAKEGATWVQIDEPVLSLDLSKQQQAALSQTYDSLASVGPKIMLASYFDRIGDNLDLALSLPTAGLHLDLVRGASDLEPALAAKPDKVLSLGLVDGRNVWRTDLDRAVGIAERAVDALGPDRVEIAPSCSLLHSPIDIDLETDLDAELCGWLAFASQKLSELAILARATSEGREAVREELAASDAAVESRSSAARIHNAEVARDLAAVTDAHLRRRSAFDERRTTQQAELGLPLYPTTTIGSFPQTQEVRHARAQHRRGELSDGDYHAFLEEKTRECIAAQEDLGLDVLVHGEFERNDMVEYFGEKLEGFAFTRHGWVQSYGSRCVKPPLIYGDVRRPTPMTVDWARFAQSQTARPVKGMLTGPVTILQWSFVRDDQPRRETCRQIALAVRDEVTDLEAAGVRVIQIDEPALREGLPLRTSDQAEYLDWAVGAFRLTASGVADGTQIHTHMCYAEFEDIMGAIAAMDADVISIETSRSDMELLGTFAESAYPNQIGPGVWDIHSPRVPDEAAMAAMLRKAAQVIEPKNLWANPDCGLKTRDWTEVTTSLRHLVGAARSLRTA